MGKWGRTDHKPSLMWEQYRDAYLPVLCLSGSLLLCFALGGWVTAESFEIQPVTAHLSPSMSIFTQVKMMVFHL